MTLVDILYDNGRNLIITADIYFHKNSTPDMTMLSNSEDGFPSS